MRQNLFKYAKKILPLLGIILFIYLIYTLDIKIITTTLASIPPLYVLFAALLTIPVALLRNVIWMMIHKQQHIRLTFRQSLKIFLIGYFYGTVTPGYIGQLMRIPYMKEKTREPYGKLFVNTFLETTLHTLSLYLMMFIGGILLIERFPELFLIVTIWTIVIGVLLAYFLSRKRGDFFFFLMIRFFIPKRGKTPVSRFVETFYQDFPRIRSLIIPCLLGGITWVITFAQEYLIVLALGLPIPFLAFLVLFPIANTAGFIPITFAGLGTREFTAIIIFSSLFAVSAESMFVVSLVGFLVTDVLTGFYGFILSLTETKKKNITFQEI
ncbi:MAG: lysylphosphatidylglycerol synthase transmembrane domain-containing protein [Methanobacteriota archaeon]